MKYTGNYQLKKPDGTDVVNIEDFNDNSDKIDLELKNLSNNKVDKVAGKQLSTEDYTTVEKNKLAGVAAGANNYVHPTSDGNLHVPTTGTTNSGKVLKAGATAGSASWSTLTKADVGLGNVENTSDANKPISTATQTALDDKADESDFTAHLADLAHVFYADDTGTANAKVVTLAPVPTTYKKGIGLSFINLVQNTGAVTINVNGLGAKSILKSNGNALSGGNLKAGIPYTIRYNGTAFILQGESEVEIGRQIITPGTTNKAILQGVHDGTGYVEGSTNLVAGNIKEEVNVFGVVGTAKTYPTAVVGDYIAAGITKLKQTSVGDAWTYTKSATMGFDGAVRVKFDLSRYGGSGYDTVYARLILNGVQVGPERSSHEAYSTEFTEDIMVKKNDVVAVEIKSTPTRYWYAQNMYLLFSFATSPLANVYAY